MALEAKVFSMAGSSASEVIFLSVSHSITLMGEFMDVLSVCSINKFCTCPDLLTF